MHDLNTIIKLFLIDRTWCFLNRYIYINPSLFGDALIFFFIKKKIYTFHIVN